MNIFLYDFVNGFYKQCAKSNKIDTNLERESDNKVILFRWQLSHLGQSSGDLTIASTPSNKNSRSCLRFTTVSAPFSSLAGFNCNATKIANNYYKCLDHHLRSFRHEIKQNLYFRTPVIPRKTVYTPQFLLRHHRLFSVDRE